MPGTGIGDLLGFLAAVWSAVPPPLREAAGPAEWHMDGRWWSYCQRIDKPVAGVPLLAFPAGAERRGGWLFGLPVVVEDGAGWPHLRERPRGGRAGKERMPG